MTTKITYKIKCDSSGLNNEAITIILMLPPDVKIETTFFRENFSAPYHAITLKNSTKKEPLISQKSLFYAVFLKFFHCQHRCLFHIKFHQIVL